MKRWKVWAALRRPKDMKGNSNRPNGAVFGCLLYIVGMDGDLIVSSHQADLGEDGTI
jgi:hypothetical protein